MSKKLELPLFSFDDLFSTEEQRQEQKLKRVQEIPAAELKPFRDLPFKVQQDEEMDRLEHERIRRALPADGKAGGGRL